MNKTIIVVGSTLATIIAGAVVKRATKYNKEGYDKKGYDRFGFDKEGYDKNGYDKNGYNKEGYDIGGYNSSGYDKQGYNRRGYNCYGFDKHGFDKNGFNKQGYDRYGFDINGFDKEGYNKCGYDEEGYDRQGLDKAKHNKEFYSKEITQLKQRVKKAVSQMKSNEYSYALHDARNIFEETLRVFVNHMIGYCENSTMKNLKICEDKMWFSDEFLDKLHGVRKICNENAHEIGSAEQFEYNTIYFVIKQVEGLLNKVEEMLFVKSNN